MKVTLFLQGFEASNTEIDSEGPLAHIAKELVQYAVQQGHSPLPMPVDDDEIILTINLSYNYRPIYHTEKAE